MNPLVSILIAAYNIEKYLDTCLDSCINQTYQNIEVIVVNDGSTDSTLSIIQKYVNKDKRIVEVTKKNGGLVSARAAGYENATGEYIFFLDGDDTIPLNSIEYLVSGLEKNTDIVVANYEIVPDNKPRVINSYGFKGENGIDLINSIFKNSLCNIWGNLYAKRIFKDVVFPLNLYKSLGEDLVTIVQLAYYSKEVKYVEKPTYHYYQRDDSLIGAAKKTSIWGSAYSAFALVTLFLKKNDILNNVSDNYLKLLKTYNMGYIASDFPISMYEKEIKDSVIYVNEHWGKFIENATRGEILTFKLANINLSFSRFILRSYMMIKNIFNRNK